MKTFQKIILASAISAAPFASQAMEALDDSVLGNTTGQAGVTIEIDLGNDGIQVGSVVYTDTAHDVVVGVDDNGTPTNLADDFDILESRDGGSVALENINVNLTGTLVQTIDVSKNGDLEMTMSSPGALTISMGNDATDLTGQYSALKLVGAAGNDSEIINNLDLALNLGASTTTIKNLGGKYLALTDRSGMVTDDTDPAYDSSVIDAADTADALINQNNALAANGLGALANAGVTGSYANDVSSMAIQMNASVQITDMNLGLFGYTNAQANILGQGHSTATDAKATLEGINDTTAIDGLTYDAVTGVASATAQNDDVDTYNGTLQYVKNLIATGSAIQVEGVTVASSTGGAIDLNQVIWAVGGDASEAGSKAGVYIQLGAMDMNINVAGIKIGDASIGSLAVNNLQLNGLTQRIYGH